MAKGEGQEVQQTDNNLLFGWNGEVKSTTEKKMEGFDENLSNISGDDVEIVRDSESMYSGGTAIK